MFNVDGSLLSPTAFFAADTYRCPESAARRSGGNGMWMEAAREIYTKMQPPPPHYSNFWSVRLPSTLSIFRLFNLATSVQ